ncbi:MULTISPECIES: antibiotic biosynthesis monooxygenase family protein [Maribacter]|uniref:Antibiotic biosynthesis monooxygenase n=1 Tax=Maribacter flavus TaxID=1658664 RepID=A0ABU7IGH9_9FLAO|nr:MULTISPECIES: antibiotic biosynthesis monooxygenase [Maribacter]MDC6404642.1 antibiotic biosynthesis monooxygenase [Maribacter sp. PR66]MEE1972054.1 antibiotic biosynthesis monooxygenase [Maribacter flavus]
MHSVIYKFNVTEGFESDFEIAWKKLTEAFMTYSGGLGSRLHKDEVGNYMAYAQWPDKETWEKARKKLPETTDELIQAMKKSCESTDVLFHLDVTKDLLKKD